MRKLYNNNKGKIHPSPPPPPTTTTHLSLLPFAIATLAASLSPEDQEVLTYLLSCSSTTTKITGKNFSGNPKTTGNHPPMFNCYCFSCYTNYWVRWDSSPNRQLIHEIIDAYEDELVNNKKSGKNKKQRKKNKVSPCGNSLHAPPSPDEKVFHAPPQVEENRVNGDFDDGDGEITSEKGSVRKFVNFIGERIWGVWGI